MSFEAVFLGWPFLSWNVVEGGGAGLVSEQVEVAELEEASVDVAVVAAGVIVVEVGTVDVAELATGVVVVEEKQGDVWGLQDVRLLVQLVQREAGCGWVEPSFLWVSPPAVQLQMGVSGFVSGFTFWGKDCKDVGGWVASSAVPSWLEVAAGGLSAVEEGCCSDGTLLFGTLVTWVGVWRALFLPLVEPWVLTTKGEHGVLVTGRSPMETRINCYN